MSTTMSLEIKYDTRWHDNLISVHRPRTKDHNQIVLDQIQEMIDKYGIEPNAQGYYYDFDLPDYPRVYEKTLREICSPVVDRLNDRYATKTLRAGKCWFQQYVKGTSFGWHTHPRSNLAIVYYPELPKGAGTEFKNIADLDIREGDILVFPAFLVHRSRSLTDGRKTIVAFNLDLDAQREDLE